MHIHHVKKATISSGLGSSCACFISDNGLCAGEGVPSHMLGERWQISPATRAIPLPLIGIKCSLNPWSDRAHFLLKMGTRQVIRISALADSELSLTVACSTALFSFSVKQAGQLSDFSFHIKIQLGLAVSPLVIVSETWNVQHARTCLSLSYDFGARPEKEREAQDSHPLLLSGVWWKCSFCNSKCWTLTWFSLIARIKRPCIFWCPILQTHEMEYRGSLKFCGISLIIVLVQDHIWGGDQGRF